MSDLSIAEDPFNTAIERAILAAGYADTIKFNIGADHRIWNTYTAAEQADLIEYWGAVARNGQWNAMILRQMNRTRIAWTGARWEYVSWSDADKAAERRAFQEIVAAETTDTQSGGNA